MRVGLLSTKGSPGVTTTALALAAASGGDAVAVELDPSGGSIECWTGINGEPGLVRAAGALRRASSIDGEVLATCEAVLPGGPRCVLAPTGGPHAESVIAACGGLASAVDAGVDLLVDAGRWAGSQATSGRLAGCDLLAVVCWPSVSGIEPVQWLLEPLRDRFGTSVVLVLIGDRPYSAGEVAATVGAPVAGVLPWDPAAVQALLTSGAGRGWSRSGLARAAASVLESLRYFSAGIGVTGGG